MERVRELNAELAFPSAKRLQSALHKEGIIIPLAEIKTSHQQPDHVKSCSRHRHIKVTSHLVKLMIVGQLICSVLNQGQLTAQNGSTGM